MLSIFDFDCTLYKQLLYVCNSLSKGEVKKKKPSYDYRAASNCHILSSVEKSKKEYKTWSCIWSPIKRWYTPKWFRRLYRGKSGLYLPNLKVKCYSPSPFCHFQHPIFSSNSNHVVYWEGMVTFPLSGERPVLLEILSLIFELTKKFYFWERWVYRIFLRTHSHISF